MPQRLLALLVLLLASACLPAAAAPSGDAAVADIAARYFADKLDLDPLAASELVSDPRYEGRLEIGIAPASIARARALNERVLRELKAVPIEGLSEAARLDHRLLAYGAEIALDGEPFHQQLMPIDHFGALPLMLANLGSGDQLQALKTPTDYDNYLKRLRRLPEWNEQAIENMREGMRLGYTVPRALIESALPTFRLLAEPRFEKSPYHAALKVMPAQFSAAERRRIEHAYRAAFTQQIAPTMARLLRFLEQAYLPACRTTSGVGALPDGPAYYAYQVRSNTTTELTPDAIHTLGLAEVARIRAEMAKVQAGYGFEGSVTEFLKWHAEQPRFMPYKTAQQVLDGYVELNRRIEPQLPTLFGRAPKQPLEIRAMPALQQDSASDYYNPPAPDGSRPGIYFARVEPAQTFHSTIMSTLFIHEGQPGHHYQMALQQELPLPAFRKYGWGNAYGEGWALYAETLGRELGLYDDPNQYLGHLKLELLRAVRLVTDTGLHARGWTREQTIRYMMDTEGTSEERARLATERYMAWPGQALAYKIGSLKIQALRERAQRALGTRFSLRDFHDLVLSEGNVPLQVLEQIVDAWIARGGPREL